MPSPVGHTLAGLTVHVLTARGVHEAWDARRAGLLVLVASAPDLDLLLRLVDGRNHHQGAWHSLGAASLVALGAWLWALARRRPGAWRIAAGVGGAWLSHVLLDYLGRDTHPPIGLMALWPWSTSYFKFPRPVFLDIGRALTWETLQHNLVGAAWEAMLLAPVLIAVLAWRARRARRA